MTDYPYGTPDDPYVVGYTSSGKVLRISPEEIEEIEQWSGRYTPKQQKEPTEGNIMPEETLLKAVEDVIKKAMEDPMTFIMQAFQRSLAYYIEESHKTAREKGWWGPDKDNPVDRNFPEQLALMHSEISEVLEEYRNHGLNEEKMIYSEPGKDKPEGIAVEFADLLIRVFDTCGRYNIPLEEALRLKMGYIKHAPIDMAERCASMTDQAIYQCLMNVPFFSAQLHTSPWIDWSKIFTSFPASLTYQETEVLGKLVDAWNHYISLPDKLDDETQEFKLAINAAQRIIGTRVARRANPEIWRQPEETNE
jgi:NTP pyrophosphatase (non-canonical NTP hydrolase)